MVFEMVGTIFLVIRSNFQTSRVIILDSNEHTYGGWRIILKYFKMAQVIGIKKKHWNHMGAVFQCGLKSCCLVNYFRGYQETFVNYV